MRELALFAGAGGGILGGKLLGWECVCAVEMAAYPRQVLLARQRDGCLPRFPIWDDVRTFDGRPWRGHVDVISGGFPCQDVSAAGKGAGITGARSGLWSEMARVVCEVQPRYVLVENSPLLVSRGLDVVLADLAALGYNAQWGVVGAHHVGAPHKRERVWVLANSAKLQRDGRENNGEHLKRRQIPKPGDCSSEARPFGNWWHDEPGMDRVVDGIPDRLVQRMRALGNGQVPAVVRLACETLAPEKS